MRTAMYGPGIGFGCFLIGPASVTTAAATKIRRDGTTLFIQRDLQKTVQSDSLLLYRGCNNSQRYPHCETPHPARAGTPPPVVGGLFAGLPVVGASPVVRGRSCPTDVPPPARRSPGSRTSARIAAGSADPRTPALPAPGL